MALPFGRSPYSMRINKRAALLFSMRIQLLLPRLSRQLQIAMNWPVRLFLLLLLLAGPVVRASSEPRATLPDLGTVLNLDGTMQSGSKGSFNASGYALHTAEDGRPVFRSQTASQLQRTASNSPLGWSDEFGINGTNGVVQALVVYGNVLYVGGFFTSAGRTPATNVAKWDGTSWSALGAGIGGTGLNSNYGTVYALAVDASGNLYAGGRFTRAGGVAASNVAKWDGSAWSVLGPGTFDEVNALVMDRAGTLYAGGKFYSNGPANHVAKWNGTAWSGMGAGLDNDVRALAVGPNGEVYAGGTFAASGSVAASAVARWNGTAWSAMGAGTNNNVNALAVDGSGNVYAGGNFSTAGGLPANRVAKWNGTAWSALGAGVSNATGNSGVTALAVDSNGILYVGGSFTTAGGGTALNMAKWDGSSWGSLQGINSVLLALAVDGSGHLYAGGQFQQAGTTAVHNVAKWTISSANWSRVGTIAPAGGIHSNVVAMAVDGSGNLYAGGSFAAAGDTVASRIAKWDGTTWRPVGGGTSNAGAGTHSVDALAVDTNGNVYAAGIFTAAGGVSASRIAKWDGTSWSALGSGLSGSVVNGHNLALDASGNLYVEGLFATAGGVSVQNIAKWDGSTWSGLNSATNGGITSIVTQGNDLYVAGLFTTIGGVSANRVAKWDGTRWSALSSGLNGLVYSLAVDARGNLYAGGIFTALGNGTPADGVAMWNGTSWSAMGSFAVPGGTVNTLAADRSGNVYAARYFRPNPGDWQTTALMKWDGIRWSTADTGIIGNQGIAEMAASASGMYVSGVFFRSGDGTVMDNIGHYTSPQAPQLRTISPTSGPTGSTVTITGTNLARATVVFTGVGNTAVTSGFTVNATGTALSGIVVPGGASTGPVTVTTAGGNSNTLPFTVQLTTATASPVSMSLALHPNPARSRVVVQVPAPFGSQATLTLSDALGRIIRTQLVKDTTPELDLRDLAPGLYLVRLQAGRQQLSQRLVVE